MTEDNADCLLLNVPMDMQHTNFRVREPRGLKLVPFDFRITFPEEIREGIPSASHLPDSPQRFLSHTGL